MFLFLSLSVSNCGQEILAAVRSGAMPSVMPARAGSALSARPQHGGGGGFTLPARMGNPGDTQ